MKFASVQKLRISGKATAGADSCAGGDDGRVASAASPYTFKSDRYSSHSVILGILGEGRNRRLLDVGAGPGYLSEALTERGYQVTAIEGDLKVAEAIEGKCSRVICADLDEPLTALGAPFDAVLYGDVLEHLKNPLRVLRDANTYLKPEGIAIISVPNVGHLYIRLQLLLGRFNYEDRGILDRTHQRFFTLASLRGLLTEAGLDILELRAIPVPLPLVVPRRFQGGLFSLLHGFNAWLANRWKTLFGYQFVAVVRGKKPA